MMMIIIIYIILQYNCVFILILCMYINIIHLKFSQK